MANLSKLLSELWNITTLELRRIFRDGGVVLLFCIATLLYPLIFGVVYKNEAVRNLPIAVVDESKSSDSRRFIHKLDATPEMNVQYKCNTMAEAERLMRQRRINGIVYFPRDYGTNIASLHTARACLFCDMSSFLYYRSVFSGTNAVLLDEMQHIETTRYEAAGIEGESAQQLVSPIGVDDVKLYLPNGGFTSFLVPAVLVLVLQQTMFLGMTVLYGTTRRNNRIRREIPIHMRNGRMLFRVVWGRALAYLLVYLPLAVIVLLLMPHLFNLPHIGNVGTLLLFIVPYLLAITFFCMTIADFVRNRDAGIVVCIFFSVILIFLSGAIWPQSNMPKFWLYFSYLFPSTPGIQCYVRINSMGASLTHVWSDCLILWIQAAAYFFTASGGLRILLRTRAGSNATYHEE